MRSALRPGARSIRLAPALAIVALMGAGCAGRDGESSSSSATILQDPRRPYVVTAIDNHFHDAHPSEPIALDRTLVFKNEGRNLHNVTIQGTTLTRDFAPGERFSVKEMGSLVNGPGRYRLICKYHAELGMSGVLVVVE